MTQLVDRPAALDRLPVVDVPLAPDRLLEVVRGLARDAETWRALARHDREQRWYVRLATNPRYDAWLIGWHAHQGVDLHDHGGSAGALCVVEGELLETSGRLGTEGGLREKRLDGRHRARRSTAGTSTGSSTRPRQVATSIHVYSPPLTTMDFYETEADSTFRRLRTEVADPRPEERHG